MNRNQRLWQSVALRRGWLLAALAGFVLGGLVFRGGTQDGDQSASPPEAEASGSDVEQIYTCSMHPQVRTTDPNEKCPICGMDLIPVPMDDHPDEDGEAPRLRLTERAAALMQVQVHPVERRTLSVPVRVYGRLGFDETRLRTISAWAQGRLEQMYVDFTGAEVQAGQPMVQLYSPELIAAQEEFLQAVRTDRELTNDGPGIVGGNTRMMTAASRDRLALLGLAQDQIAKLEQRGRVADLVTITAPVGGIVIDRLATTGDYVATGQPLYRIADLSHLWAQLEVYESDLQWLAVGQKTSLTAQSYPGELFEGTVAFIDPTVSDRARTVRVRVDIPNPDGRLKPGMLVRGNVQATHDHEAPLVIPVTAPLITGQRAIVYVQIQDEDRPTFESRDVVLGPKAGEWYIIREGLQEHDLVVVHGAFKIDSELQIRGRPSMMQPAGGTPSIHDHSGQHGPQSEPIASPAAFRHQLGGLVVASFVLVLALAGDDQAAARQAAADVNSALHAIEPVQLSDDHGRQRWDALAGTMHQALADLGAAGELAVQRPHFETFSDAMTEAVQIFRVEVPGAVYRAMCPMVEGRRGYWLQPDSTITNPYHGASMLRCGAIVEVLAKSAADTGSQP